MVTVLKKQDRSTLRYNNTLRRYSPIDMDVFSDN